jgi:Spy/CpxP family protein refolding chaperone
MKNSQNTGRSRSAMQIVKIVFVLAIIVSAALYAISSYRSHTRGLPSAREERRQMARPAENRRGSPERMFARFAENLELTPEQQKQMRELREQERPSSPEEWRARREKFQEILTPEQREKLGERREAFRGRMAQRMQRVERILGPKEYEKFLERLEKRRQERGSRRPGRRPEAPRRPNQSQVSGE